jgi:hypothetical protein
MPISYRILPEARLVHAVVAGVVTDADILAYRQRLNADPHFEPGMSEFVDCRNVERLEVTSQGIRGVVWHDERHKDRLGGHQLAVVASADVVFGMARMYQTQSNGDVGVFRTIREALDFLGKPTIPS